MNTCLIGGRFVGVVVVLPLPVVAAAVLEPPAVVGVGDAGVAVVIVTVPPPPTEPPPAEFPPADDGLVLELEGETAKIKGASVSAALPLTIEPTITPNPSIPMTATAAARGAPNQASKRRGSGAGVAAGIGPPTATGRPCSRISPITPDM